MIFLLALAASPRFQTLREADVNGSLAAPEAARLHAYEALATCQPIRLSSETAAFVAEQKRGARLNEVQRAGTVWREIDAFDLRGSVDEASIVWPKSRERWRDETPIVPTLTRACTPQKDALAAEYRALVAADERNPVITYETLRVAFALEKFIDVPVPPLGDALAPYAVLLVLEHRFALGTHDPALRAAYAALATKLPALSDSLFVRQLQIAQADKDTAAIATLVTQDIATPAVDRFRLAVWAQHATPSAVLAGVVEEPNLDKDGDANAEIVRERVRDAAAREPFTRQTVAAMETISGKSHLTREVYRVATLAASRRNLATAKDAYAWILAHGKSMSGDTHTKLALVAMLTLDVPALERELTKVAELPSAEHQLASLVTAVQTGTVRDPSLIAALRRAIVGHKLNRDAAALLTAQLDAATHAKALQIVLSDDAAPRQPLATPVTFDFPEPYSLIPNL